MTFSDEINMGICRLSKADCPSPRSGPYPIETDWCYYRGSKELQYSTFMPQCREEFSESSVVDENWFIRIGHFWGLQVSGQEMPPAENLLGYSFIIKEQVRRGEHLCLFWVDTMLPSSVPSPGWVEEFSYSYMVKLGPQSIAFYCVQKACPHLLSSLGRMWASCHTVLLFWGQVSCLYHMVLLLNKPAWFCG